MTRLVLRLATCTAVACVALFSVLAHAQAQDSGITQRRLKFAMSVGVNSPWTQAAQRFARTVDERTGGQIKITVFPDGQLSNGNQIAEFDLLKNGTVDFTFHSSIILSAIDARFALFSMPFIAGSDKELYALMDGPGRTVWEGLGKVGVVPLGAFSSSGFRQLTNNKIAVRRPEDLKGLTLRVPGLKLYQAIFKQMGVNPVPTSFGELYGALQQGVVDGQENPLSLIFASRFHEVQKFLTIWNYSGDSIGILSNSKLWETLSAKEREILTAAAKEAAAWHREAQSAADLKALEGMKAKLQVVTLSPEERAAFQKVMQPIYAEWESVIGADIMKAARTP